jgi:hypothetical protein
VADPPVLYLVNDEGEASPIPKGGVPVGWTECDKKGNPLIVEAKQVWGDPSYIGEYCINEVTRPSGRKAFTRVYEDTCEECLEDFAINVLTEEPEFKRRIISE